MPSRDVKSGSDEQLGEGARARNELSRRRFLEGSAGALALAGLSSAMLAACGGTEGGDTSTGGGTDTGGGPAGNGGRIVIATPGGWQGLDVSNPAYIANGPNNEILEACCGTLTLVALPAEYEEAKAAAAAGRLNGEPGLAESWDISEDGRVYTFHLRRNARSGEGNPLEADDVIWSLSRSLAFETSVGTFLLGLGGLTRPEQMRRVDANTVEMTFPAAPPSYFLQILGLSWLSIYDSKVMRRNATAREPWANTFMTSTTVGFGRYKIQRATRGREAVLVPNEGFWGDPAPFSEIVQQGVDDQGTRLQLVLTDSAQYTGELTALQWEQANSNPDTAATRFTSSRVAFLVMDNTRAPFDDVRFRQAITRAMPYDDIIETVYRGEAQRWRSGFTPWFQGATDRYWDYERDEALIREAFAPVAGTPLTLNYVKGFGAGEQIGVLVKQALEEFGLTVELQGLTRAVADARKVTDGIPFFIDDSDSPAVPNPLYELNYLYATRAFQNMARYSNPEIDRLTEQLARTREIEAQNEIIDRATQIIVEEMPYIQLAYTGTVGVHQKSLGGIQGGEIGLIIYANLEPAAA